MVHLLSEPQEQQDATNHNRQKMPLSLLRQDNHWADESKQLRPSAFLPSSLALTRGRPFDAEGAALEHGKRKA
jgi:hypothetical protein